MSASFNFDNTYARELEGFFTPWQPAQAPAPKLIKLNHALAEELGIAAALRDADAAAIFAGNVMPEGATPLAMAYAGHQFGGFSPQLGDGRALLLGEVIDRHGQRRDIALKGSGRTPFSRGGDGKAVLGPVLREYLIGEAMHALGIPTTRALAAVTTGEDVMRERPLPGAVLGRVAASHIRVGTFQFFFARGDNDKVKRLADYTIARHYPALRDAANPYLAFLDAVIDRQASLVARWMGVGFIHGVMNTDNMALSGETIDYGPCAFMNAYDPATVFSSIDHQGRYAYANQPQIANWNLARFAETLLPLIDTDTERAVGLATASVQAFPAVYAEHRLRVMSDKLGLRDADAALADDLLTAMEGQRADFTLVFRHLADAAIGNEEKARALFSDPTAFDAWLSRWRARLDAEGRDAKAVAGQMNRVNPIIIPRNHQVEEALAAATAGDLQPFDDLLAALEHPFDDDPARAAYATPDLDHDRGYQTFCGT